MSTYLKISDDDEMNQENLGFTDMKDLKVEYSAFESTRGSIPGEIVSLTSLRGMLAVWIVWYHFWNDLLRLFPIVDLLSPLVRSASIAVPAFFMLSGFVLSYNYGERFGRVRRSEVIRFLYLRLARIYPVHLVTLLTVMAMVWFSERVGYKLTDAGYSPRDFLLNLLLIHTWVPDFKLNWNYPSWSLSSEWFAYILFPFAVTLIMRRLTTPLLATLFGLVALICSVAVSIYWRPWPFYELVLVVPTFFAGASIYWILRNRLGKREVLLWHWLPELLLIALASACFMPSIEVKIASLLCGFFLLIMALVLLGSRCNSLWTIRPTLFLGKVSYSLYMSHTLAQKILYRLLPTSRFESVELLSKLSVIAAYAGILVVCCLLTYFLVESPCRRFFKKALSRSIV